VRAVFVLYCRLTYNQQEYKVAILSAFAAKSRKNATCFVRSVLQYLTSETLNQLRNLPVNNVNKNLFIRIAVVVVVIIIIIINVSRFRTPASCPVLTQSWRRCWSLHLVFGRSMSHLPFGTYSSTILGIRECSILLTRGSQLFQYLWLPSTACSTVSYSGIVVLLWRSDRVSPKIDLRNFVCAVPNCWHSSLLKTQTSLQYLNAALHVTLWRRNLVLQSTFLPKYLLRVPFVLLYRYIFVVTFVLTI
jgi:hypothetical protein